MEIDAIAGLDVLEFFHFHFGQKVQTFLFFLFQQARNLGVIYELKFNFVNKKNVANIEKAKVVIK